MATQDGFGRILNELAQGESELAARIVTTSPDVTVSTNLGPWVNRRGIFNRSETSDTFAQESVVSAQKWQMSPQGQHIELGIAETNLFLQLSALGQVPTIVKTDSFPRFQARYADPAATSATFEQRQRILAQTYLRFPIC